MPILTGMWKANVNGYEIDLRIDTVDQMGNLIGSIFNEPMRGFWDESSQTATFSVYVNVGGFSIATFKGYLFRTPVNPQPGMDVIATLAGSFQLTDSNLPFAAVGTARRNVFGWYARISEVN